MRAELEEETCPERRLAENQMVPGPANEADLTALDGLLLKPATVVREEVLDNFIDYLWWPGLREGCLGVPEKKARQLLLLLLQKASSSFYLFSQS